MGWIAFFSFVTGFVAFAWLAQRKEWSETVIGGGSLAAGGVMKALGLSLAAPDKPPPVPLTAAEQRQTRIESQFSAWNGAHRNLEAAVKKAMNDPGSYEHVETKYMDREDHIMVWMTYRGANAFGGKVLARIVATADLDGNLLTVQNIKL